MNEAQTSRRAPRRKQRRRGRSLLVLLLVSWVACSTASAAVPSSGQVPVARRVLRQVGRGAKKLLRASLVALEIQTAVTLGAISTNASTSPTKQTVVFSSGHVGGPGDGDLVPTAIASRVVDFAMYAPIVLRQNLLGHKVIWISDASLGEIQRSIEDPRFRSVIFVGHGATGVFQARDGTYLSTYYAGALKPGELLQYTCGGGTAYTSFPSMVLADPSRGFTFDQPVYTWINWLSTWQHLGQALDVRVGQALALAK